MGCRENVWVFIEATLLNPSSGTVEESPSILVVGVNGLCLCPTVVSPLPHTPTSQTPHQSLQSFFSSGPQHVYTCAFEQLTLLSPLPPFSMSSLALVQKIVPTTCTLLFSSSWHCCPLIFLSSSVAHVIPISLSPSPPSSLPSLPSLLSSFPPLPPFFSLGALQSNRQTARRVQRRDHDAEEQGKTTVHQ